MNLRSQTFSLRTRLTVLLALAVLVALGGAARIVDWRADAEMQQRFDASLLARAQSLAALVHVEDGKIALEVEDVTTPAFPGNADAHWYLITCDGHVVARTAETPPVAPVDEAPAFTDARIAGHALRVVSLRFHPGHEGAGAVARVPRATCELHYGLDRKPLDDILGILDIILAGSLAGAFLLVLLATPWLVRRGLRPLSVLDRAMAGIGPDAPGGRLPASDTTELVPLVTRFNEVLGRMDEGLARERQFASGLAHEFRTRLAELRALVDVEARYPSGRDVHSVLGEVGSIGRELEATVTALLQLTRIQSGLEHSRPENVPLEPLLARVRGRHEEAARVRDVRIESVIACEPGATLRTDPVLLEIVLDNLLGNAVAYAPVGSHVGVHALPGGIDVRNPAPGLQADDLARFGRSFWRKDAAGAGHAGLGLALATAAARALGMELSFTLAEGGLRAALRWRG